MNTIEQAKKLQKSKSYGELSLLTPKVLELVTNSSELPKSKRTAKLGLKEPFKPETSLNVELEVFYAIEKIQKNGTVKVTKLVLFTFYIDLEKCKIKVIYGSNSIANDLFAIEFKKYRTYEAVSNLVSKNYSFNELIFVWLANQATLEKNKRGEQTQELNFEISEFIFLINLIIEEHKHLLKIDNDLRFWDKARNHFQSMLQEEIIAKNKQEAISISSLFNMKSNTLNNDLLKVWLDVLNTGKKPQPKNPKAKKA